MDETASPKILTLQAARILNVGPDSVRRYERLGLLTAERTEGGVRLFDRSEVEALAAERRDSEHSNRRRFAGSHDAHA